MPPCAPSHLQTSPSPSDDSTSSITSMTTARSSSANTRFAAPISGAGDALGKQRPRGDHCAGASHGHSSQQRSRSSGRRRAERHSRKAKDHGVRLEAEYVMLRMPKGASCESARCTVPCRRRTVADRHDIVCVVLGLRKQAECPGRGARSATHGCTCNST